MERQCDTISHSEHSAQALSEDDVSHGSGQSDSGKEVSASSSDEGSDSDADAGAVGHTKKHQQGYAGVLPPVMLESSPA